MLAQSLKLIFLGKLILEPFSRDILEKKFLPAPGFEPTTFWVKSSCLFFSLCVDPKTLLRYFFFRSVVCCSLKQKIKLAGMKFFEKLPTLSSDRDVPGARRALWRATTTTTVSTTTTTPPPTPITAIIRSPDDRLFIFRLRILFRDISCAKYRRELVCST